MPYKDIEVERERQRVKSRKNQEKIADIGELPRVVNSERRERGRNDLLYFLQTYFPDTTGLSPFSFDHIEVIQRMQEVLTGGGKFANVVFRGFAKTTISENAAIWATAYGHLRFIPVIGATSQKSKENIESIKSELASNDLLYEDFPEICHAIRALEGKTQRCKSQTHQGEQTHISWVSDSVVYPTIKLTQAEAAEKGIPVDARGYTLASGSKILTRGITGSLRGLTHKRQDGTQQRPDGVLIDDPQTEQSADTEHQVEKRLRIIKASIVKLAGHRNSIAVICNGTVIRPNDVMHQLLDHTLSPSWEGKRIPMVRQWSLAHESFWMGEYKRVRTTYDPERVGDAERARRESTELYRSRRAEADAGCMVCWNSCYDPENEESAIQHAYNFLIDDGEEVFASEAQGTPLARKSENAAVVVPAAVIRSRCNGLSRGLVPVWATQVTSFFDVHQELIYWVRMAWGPGFTGAVLDYDVWPEQSDNYFAMRSAKPTITSRYPSGGVEAKITAALTDCTNFVLGSSLETEASGEMRVARAMVDAGKWTDDIFEFVRRSPHAGILLPSHGVGIGARNVPMSKYTPKPGEIIQSNCIVSAPGKRAIRSVSIDTNHWKTFVHNRLRTPIGDSGALTLYGKRPEEHKLFADHLNAEIAVQTSGRGRSLEEWSVKPGKPDNHWFDCVVGNCVAASLCGISLSSVSKPTVKKKAKRTTVWEI